MTPHATRTLRAGLLALLVLVLAAVAWSLRKPGAGAPTGRPSAADDSGGTTSTGLVLRSFREGDERFLVEAESSQGQEKEGRAVAQRSNDTMDFSGGVVVRQGADWLEAAQLTLGFLGDFEVITRALAKEDVRLQTGDAQILPGTKGGPVGTGGRRLACRKLDVVFRPEGTMQQAVASGGHDEAGNPLYADLELLPVLKG